MRPLSRACLRPAAGVLPAVVAVAVGALLMCTYSVGQWTSMQVPSWDLAIFSELAKAYAHLEAPVVPIKGEGYNLLGDHFHPVLVLLAPVWALWPSPLALLLVQDLLLAVSAWPITRAAARTVGPWAGGALGLVYVLSWGLQGAVAAQFHEIAFAVPMLAWASAAFVEGRWRSCAAWVAPLVLVKEDLGLTVLMAGLAIAWRGQSDEVRLGRHRLTGAGLGLGLALLGLLSFLLTVAVILPALSPTGAWEYGLGGNSGDGSGASTVSGGLLERLLTPSVKVATLGVLATTAGLVGLASPWMALVLPTLAWRFLSGKEAYWQWEHWHYNAVLMPVAVGALLDVLRRLKGDRPWAQAAAGVRWLAAVAVGLPIALGVATAPRLALAGMLEEGWGQEPPRAQAARQVVETVAQGSTVETDLGLLAYLVPRASVYWVGTSSVDTDYVVIDSYSPAWGGNPPADAAEWAMSTSSSGAVYQLVLDVGGYQVAQRVGQ
ncbi:DUF2079 domain-containing protein [Actinomyces sp. W5033]|uniref:DUF2079 domain-containing protein n=1 Tax=Actinomyces sp. W5033 TaxID=3446479 RepID=UPI003EE21862